MTSVPNIFVNGEHVGGFEDLKNQIQKCEKGIPKYGEEKEKKKCEFLQSLPVAEPAPAA